MEMDLAPKLAKKMYGGVGGTYFAWSPEELPMLCHGNIGAAKLALEKDGFALPCYSDSAKVAYVLQGLDESSAICKALDDVHLINGLECKMTCSSSKISYVLDMEGFFYRVKRLNVSSAHDQARIARFHRFLAAS